MATSSRVSSSIPAPTTAIGGDLPIHLTRFVGRGSELESLMPLLESTRLITLTGAGGSGKTRLANELASQAAQRFSRVVWVDLAPLTDAHLLAEQVGAALQAVERPDANPIAMLVDAIGDERFLVVLDNCEHLVDACANLADAILRACPRLTLVATSREALGVASETAWLVPPLVEAEATQLFVERAQASVRGFVLTDQNAAAIREICRRLDGIPLAIELAAARVRVLSPEQIAARLDDAFRLLSSGSRTALPRHRTLRATMEWSFALLGEREQTLLRRLSVFVGSFSLDAAESICAGGGLEVDDILDGVGALVDKSLVVLDSGDGDARYRLLETVRQYARERLIEFGEQYAMDRRHAEHFIALVEGIAPFIVGGEAPALTARLRIDHDNIRAASLWSVADPSRADIALRFAGGLFWFWYSVGSFRENRQIVDRALAIAADGEFPPVLYGRALLSSGLTGIAQGEYNLAREQLSAAVSILRRENDEANYRIAQAKLGAAWLLDGKMNEAVAILDEAIATALGLSDMGGNFARFWRAFAAYVQGDYDRACELLVANLDIGRNFDRPTTIAHTTAVLARAEFARGNLEVASAVGVEALERELALGDAWGTSIALDVACMVAARAGAPENAIRLIAGTEAHRHRTAIAAPGIAPAERQQMIDALRSKVGMRFDSLWTEGRVMPMSDATAMAFKELKRHVAGGGTAVTSEMAVPVLEVRSKVRVHALGPLQVFVDDKPVDATAWGSARPRELLVYLLMHPEGRTKEQVGLAFWPEASTAQLRNNFHVTLHRLRRALGAAEWVVLENDRYRVDPALVASFDVAEFTAAITEARRAVKRQETGATARLDAALALYRGDLLDGEPVGDWHQEHRDHLQRTYIESLMDLGNRLVAEDRATAAADAYRRVLARDELNEDAALALMKCHSATGERASALKVYRRLADKLREELDAEPGREVARFAERLQQGAPAI